MGRGNQGQHNQSSNKTLGKYVYVYYYIAIPLSLTNEQVEEAIKILKEKMPL